jgi:hypothetical protein
LVDTGADNSIRNLHARSGFNLQTRQYDSTREAAPFAILDVMYTSHKAVQAVKPDIEFPALRVGWSVNNVSGGGDITQGLISTSSYDGLDLILILGDSDNDTDEYDISVIAHEWGHYYASKFSRDDQRVSAGRSTSIPVDHRLAYSEGLATALSGLNLGISTYTDSGGSGQNQTYVAVDLELNTAPGLSGWFNEDAVTSVIYDLIDNNDDDNDSLSLGMLAFIDALSALADDDSLVGIHNFITQIKANHPNDVSAIDSIVNAQNITATAIDAFATSETNNAEGNTYALPLYTEVIPGGPSVVVCSDSEISLTALLGARRFLRFDLATAENVNINISKHSSSDTSNTDPDFSVYSKGNLILLAQISADIIEDADITLLAGTHIIEVYDYNVGSPGASSCFETNVSIN